MSKKTEILQAIIIDGNHLLDLQELCHSTKLDTAFIIEMIEEELLHPQGKTPAEWRFDSHNLKRAYRAASFRNDLEVNLAGIALSLDLLDQLDELQKELDHLRRLLKE